MRLLPPSKSLLTATVTLLVTYWPALASVYDNGAPDRVDAWEMTAFVQADDFVLAKATRLDRVTFWEADALPFAFAGSFDWQIHSNTVGNSPGDVIASGTSANLSRVATGATVRGGYPEYLATFDIAPLSLPPGTYWLALHNGPPSNFLDYVLYWETTAAGDTLVSHERFTETPGPWYTNTYPGHSGELAFQIHGASAPDIATLAFQGDGLHLSVTTEAGYNYQIEYKNNIKDVAWTPLPGGEFVSGTGQNVDVVDHTPGVRNLPHRFYRAKLL